MSNDYKGPHFIGHHIETFPITKISVLAPYSHLILSIVLIILFLVRFYVLEAWLLRRLYGSQYTDLSEINRRGFVNHHIAGATKLTIFVVGIYPFMAVTFTKDGFHTPFAPGSQVTLGDILLVNAQMLVGMFIFELIYRVKVSPVSVVHHLGSILVAQAAIVISINQDRDASIEFVLCTVWGAFDIICEFLPHLTMILYRVYPTSHVFLANLFRVACLTTFAGTISETILTMYFFGILWHRWSIAFKVATPMLHIAFSAAQFHGTMIFYRMWRKQERLMLKGKASEKDLGQQEEGDPDRENPERTEDWNA
jgi:hypothetical protein